MICKHCGEVLPDDAQFCGVCGNVVTNEPETRTVYCPNCGETLKPESMFCANCGRAVTAQDHVPQPNLYAQHVQNTYADGKKNGNQTIVIVILIVVIVALLGGIGGFFLFNHLFTPPKDNAISASPAATATPGATMKPKASPTPTPAPTPSIDEVNANPDINEYMFRSDLNIISDRDLAKLNQAQTRLLLNEMYARHGYIFSTKEYSDYFSKRTWYIPRYTSQSDAEAGFNDIERRNKIIISDYEKAKGWR